MREFPGQQSTVTHHTGRTDEESSRLRATDWWMEGELRRLNVELTRTREELETLRSTTAQVVTAILAALQAQPGPVSGVAPEIQELAELSTPTEDRPAGEPMPGGGGAMDQANQDSLAYLDRRFRWVRSRRPAAEAD